MSGVFTGLTLAVTTGIERLSGRIREIAALDRLGSPRCGPADWVRFTFSRNRETLEEAIARLDENRWW